MAELMGSRVFSSNNFPSSERALVGKTERKKSKDMMKRMDLS